MKKLRNLLGIRVEILAAMIFGLAAGAFGRTTTYTGKIATYPIIVILEFDNQNNITGKYALQSVLDRMGDKESSWFTIKSTAFQFNPGISGGRTWQCDILNHAGKKVSTWVIDDNPSVSSNLNVIISNTEGKEYRLTLKPKRR